MARAAATMLRLRLRIRGRVQGVWYRGATQTEAARLGVRGWVRNCDDGSVEAVLEGEPAAVRQLEAWCHEGPPAAQVHEVLVHEEEEVEPVGREAAFRIRH